MSINLQGLKELLKSTGYPVFRDKAVSNTKYPYIVYSFVSEDIKMAGSRVHKTLPLYQVSLFTTGTEEEFRSIIHAFDSARVPTTGVMAIVGDENDDTVTNYFVQVRVVEGAG